MSKFVLIAGPCVIESEENAMYIAESIKGIAERMDLDYYFKASFRYVMESVRSSVSLFSKYS